MMIEQRTTALESIVRAINNVDNMNTYYDVCGRAWMAYDLDLISLDEACALIEEAANVLHGIVQPITDDTDFAEFDEKVYNLFGELTFDGKDPECIAAFCQEEEIS